MTDNLFEGNATLTNGEVADPNNQQGLDTSTDTTGLDQLSEFVGEGKKYKTYADLAKAVHEKESFIERLKNESAGMREDIERLQSELTTATKLDDVLNKMTASRGEKSNQPLDGDEVRKLVKTALEETATEERQKANMQESQGAVLARFNGDMTKAREFIAEKAQALGMTTKDLMQIAVKSPSGFTKLVGVDSVSKTTANQPNARSSDAVSNQPTNEPNAGTEAYYNHLRKTNPKLYWAPKTQQQLLKDAMNDPVKFKGR